MDKAVVDVPRWRFSTDTLPERERCEAVHALYGHHTVMAYEALPDVPVYLNFTQRRLPGLLLVTGTSGTVRRAPLGRVIPTTTSVPPCSGLSRHAWKRRSVRVGQRDGRP
jgi:hypothetical protein